MPTKDDILQEQLSNASAYKTNTSLPWRITWMCRRNNVHAETVPFVRDSFNFWLKPVWHPPNLFVYL